MLTYQSPDLYSLALGRVAGPASAVEQSMIAIAANLVIGVMLDDRLFDLPWWFWMYLL